MEDIEKMERIEELEGRARTRAAKEGSARRRKGGPENFIAGGAERQAIPMTSSIQTLRKRTDFNPVKR